MSKLFIPFMAYFLFSACTVRNTSDTCVSCHTDLTPQIVTDFSQCAMSDKLTCENCHGSLHRTRDDVEKVLLPTIHTCKNCHGQQVAQYLSGKHAYGGLAVDALPYSHIQPKPFTDGRKGCGGCHTMGIKDQEDRKTPAGKYYPYGMDCRNCHTRHLFSKVEASEPEACMTCHTGFDHPQWEMWSGSKHGVIYLLNRNLSTGKQNRAPKCQTCHMPDGNHRVFSAWGYFGIQLENDDPDWEKDQKTILKALGVLDTHGNPGPRLETFKNLKMVRTTKAEFLAERKQLTDICLSCHSRNFVNQNMKNADLMLKESDKLFAQAIELVSKTKNSNKHDKQPTTTFYPDLLALYNIDNKIEGLLYEMFMNHRMTTFQAGFHMNPEYATWKGFAKLHTDLTEIKELTKK